MDYLGLTGRGNTTAPTEAVVGVGEEIMATATAATQPHPAGEVLEERLSEIMSERETGTVLTEMLPSGMKCSETTSTDISVTINMATNGTTSTETITTGKVEIGRHHNMTTGTATRETTQGMVAGRAANSSNRVMVTVKRGEHCYSVYSTIDECNVFLTSFKFSETDGKVNNVS